jgi:hypothetical protein
MAYLDAANDTQFTRMMNRGLPKFGDTYERPLDDIYRHQDSHLPLQVPSRRRSIANHHPAIAGKETAPAWGKLGLVGAYCAERNMHNAVRLALVCSPWGRSSGLTRSD